MGRSQGFSLIEVMITVGIIALLAALAVPTYNRYQAQSRQAEAKMALAAIYVAEVAFYAEHNAYIAGMDAIGYEPEGERRFYQLGWQAPSNAGIISNYNFVPSVPSYEQLGVPPNFDTCTPHALSSNPAPATVNPLSFSVIATGQILPGAANCDTWEINERKEIRNLVTGFD